MVAIGVILLSLFTTVLHLVSAYLAISHPSWIQRRIPDHKGFQVYIIINPQPKDNFV